MSDRIVLMRQGRIEQVGAPREMYDRPASRYVADFIGETNLLAGAVLESAAGTVSLKVGDAVLRATADAPLEKGAEAWLTVRPEAIRLAESGAGPGENALEGTVADAVYAGFGAPASRRRWPTAAGWWPTCRSGTSVANGSAVTLAWAEAQGRCVGD